MTELLNEELNGDGDIEEQYIIHIDNFDGSLDLLWHLIRKSRIDITEISISEITEQYINYLKLMKRLNIKVASEFVMMASELLFYKSKALLPGEEIEDEYFIPPLPADLIQKLLEFKKYQLTSQKLKKQYDFHSNLFFRKNESTEITDDGEVAIEATLYDLIDAFARLLESGEEAYTREVEFNEVLVSDRIDHITSLLNKKQRMLFSEVFSERPSRAEIIASLLAILEMTKGRQIKLMQFVVFGEIIILRNYYPDLESFKF